MMERLKNPVLYVCDPEKNVVCNKTICKHNPNAKVQACAWTWFRKFAKRDELGIPIKGDCFGS